MSNNPTQQAELYRKAAETIEMCAKHGIDAKVKLEGKLYSVVSRTFECHYADYEFPLAVIEGKLIWKGTPIYDKNGNKIIGELADNIIKNCVLSVADNVIWYQLLPYTLTKPKQPLCEVEGKPVFHGDMLWLPKYNVAQYVSACWSKEDFEKASWNKQKRTVMVELLVEDVEFYAKPDGYSGLADACRKALDNLK